MLNEHLAPMSRTLLAARDIAPIARSRAGHRAEMACLAEARESLPAAVPGDSAGTRTRR